MNLIGLQTLKPHTGIEPTTPASSLPKTLCWHWDQDGWKQNFKMYLSWYTSAGHKGAVVWSYLKCADLWKKRNGAGSLAILYTVNSIGVKFGVTLYGHRPPWSSGRVRYCVRNFLGQCGRFQLPSCNWRGHPGEILEGMELENRLSSILQSEVTWRYSPACINIRIQFQCSRPNGSRHITQSFMRNWESFSWSRESPPFTDPESKIIQAGTLREVAGSNLGRIPITLRDLIVFLSRSSWMPQQYMK